MINSIFFTQAKFGIMVLLTALFLQGCGGERTEPYNPSSSSSSSSGAKVTVEALAQGTDTSSVIAHEDKRLQVMRNENDFYDISDYYVNFNLGTPNFTDGQVVLLDLGKQDSCKQHLEFNSIRAEESGTEGVKVVVSYSAKAATTSGCSSVITRPYYLYYVQSRDAVIFEESIL